VLSELNGGPHNLNLRCISICDPVPYLSRVYFPDNDAAIHSVTTLSGVYVDPLGAFRAQTHGLKGNCAQNGTVVGVPRGTLLKKPRHTSVLTSEFTLKVLKLEATSGTV
jgi:hypothetical protein